MCGRYSLTTDIRYLEKRFNFDWTESGYGPRFNIAPTQPVITITSDGSSNQGQNMKWGLVPYWSKTQRMASHMINARAETLEQRNSFRQLLTRRRCLILADGFYEWARENNMKVPMRIALKSGEPFGFAGLWDIWSSSDGEQVKSCTIITTEANKFIDPLHNRMPVIVPSKFEKIWLSIVDQDIETIKGLLIPFESVKMEAYEVSTLVNSPANNFSEIIKKVNIS